MLTYRLQSRFYQDLVSGMFVGCYSYRFIIAFRCFYMYTEDRFKPPMAVCAARPRGAIYSNRTRSRRLQWRRSV